MLHNLFILFFFVIYSLGVYASVDQILNDNFFQNPAKLNTIKKMQVIAGNVFINPEFTFQGTALGETGSTKSNVRDYLPYVLGAARVCDRGVVGVNITPSGYGHLDWPMDSIVSPASTVTKVLYYRFGVQSSYQLTDALAVGAGFNVEDNGQYQLNFVIPGRGNQINSVSGVNYIGDLGFYYKINSRNYLTLAGYSQVDTYGSGHSSLGSYTVNDLSLNITEAPVIYVGIEHWVNDAWFLEGKIYWSGWSIQQNIDFTNTSTGTYSLPTNWRDVWSFQLVTRYAASDKFALLGGLIYETNPVPLATNAIGYPLAASGAISGGVDIALRQALSMQVMYSYGAFLPNAQIDYLSATGTINARFQAAVLQFVYKI